MDLSLLVNLTAKAWCLKILASLHRGTPGRQASLIAATGASRSAFAASLEHLVGLGVVERNPGHGHPLRPEIRLTASGRALAPSAHRILSAVPDDETFGLVRRRWTLPVLAITGAPTRFSQIKASLGAVTDRALAQSLGMLEAEALVNRRIDLSERTPFPTYQAIRTGEAIHRAIVIGA